MHDKTAIITDNDADPVRGDCPLCGDTATAPWFRMRRRRWLRCTVCDLVFVPRHYHLDPADEKQRYDTHNNDPADPHYRAFLSQLFEPMRARLSPGASGLDFGSGPGPTLSLMFGEAGFPTAIWDPYYAPDPMTLERQYDFVTCSETVEHFADPAADWARLVARVRPGGLLGVMTSLLEGDTDFSRWYYKNDPTHVAFYSAACLAWIADRYRLRLEILSSSVALLVNRP